MDKEKILDAWLVLRYQAGEKKALAHLVKRWYPRLQRQIYWHIRDVEAVGDIAQESWYAILKGLPRLKNAERFSVWAARIAYFKAMDWLRQQQQRTTMADLREASDYAPEEEDAENRIGLIRKEMARLPDHLRIILSLFYLEEYPLREISLILKIPVNTVKSRLFQAREKLKKSLKIIENEKSGKN